MGERFWLCERGGQPTGPYTREEVAAVVRGGIVGPHVLCCPEGGTAWLPLSAALPPGTGAPPPAPPPLPATATTTPDSGFGWVVPVTADPLSIVGSYLGLFGLVFPLLGPVALGLGIAAWRRRERYRGSAGAARTVVTIILGAIGTLTTLAWCVPLVMMFVMS